MLSKSEMHKVQELYNSSQTAQAVIDHYSIVKLRRRKHKGGLELARLLQDLNDKVTVKEFYRFWKSLETLGLGRLIIGRRGKATRFKLRRDLFLVDIVGAASGFFSLNKPVVTEPKNAIRAGHAYGAQAEGVSVTFHKDGSITIPKGVSLTEVVQVLQDAVA